MGKRRLGVGGGRKNKSNALCPRSEEVTTGEIQHPNSDVVALEMTEMSRETQ